MRPQIVKILTIVLFTLNSTIMLAQAKGSGAGPPSPSNNLGPEFPIDDHIYILFFMGLLLGVYFVLKTKQFKNTPS